MASAQTREFLRQSREIMRQNRESGMDVEDSKPITIHVSPKKKLASRTPNAFRHLARTDEYLTFNCLDGTLILPLDIARHSGLVKQLFGLGGDGGAPLSGSGGLYSEQMDYHMRLAFPSAIIERIFEYSFEDYLLNRGIRDMSARRRLFTDPSVDFFDEGKEEEEEYNVLFGSPPTALSSSPSSFMQISSSPPLSGLSPKKR